jgi:hypothetical protein
MGHFIPVESTIQTREIPAREGSVWSASWSGDGQTLASKPPSNGIPPSGLIRWPAPMSWPKVQSKPDPYRRE